MLLRMWRWRKHWLRELCRLLMTRCQRTQQPFWWKSLSLMVYGRQKRSGFWQACCWGFDSARSVEQQVVVMRLVSSKMAVRWDELAWTGCHLCSGLGRWVSRRVEQIWEAVQVSARFVGARRLARFSGASWDYPGEMQARRLVSVEMCLASQPVAEGRSWDCLFYGRTCIGRPCKSPQQGRGGV